MAKLVAEKHVTQQDVRKPLGRAKWDGVERRYFRLLLRTDIVGVLMGRRWVAVWSAVLTITAASIDREALVNRHNVHTATIDPASPVTVGNGEFAFTADVTGLQTLNATYRSLPLQTMTHASYGWHSVPPGAAGADPGSYQYQQVSVGGHTAKYATNCTRTPTYDYLRGNPHRINLLRLFLRRLTGAAMPIDASAITQINQTLLLWEGRIESSFELDGELVTVSTAVHPTLDAIGVGVCSSLIKEGKLGLGLSFPYASSAFAGGTDWTHEALHSSEIIHNRPTTLVHKLDGTTYYITARLSTGASLTAGIAKHDFSIVPARESCLSAVLWVSASLQDSSPPSFEELAESTAAHWAQLWRSGAAVELSGSTANGAAELERRVVLSQYISMSQEAGSNPPQETGLMTNSWYGKFHLEMRFHHQFHHMLWGRPELAQRSEPYFDGVREVARNFTRQMQNYKGPAPTPLDI